MQSDTKCADEYSSPLMSTTVHHRCLEGLEQLEALAPRLDRLVDRLREEQPDRPWIYLSSIWLVAWARHAEPQPKVVLYLAESADGELLGVAALSEQRVRIGRCRPVALTFLGWPETDSVEVAAVSDEVRRDLIAWAWEHARQHRPNWHCWMLRELDREGPTARAITELRGNGFPQVHAGAAGISPMVDLEAWAEHGDPRNKRQRARARKFERALKGQGELASEFRRLPSDDIASAWEEFVGLENRSWRDGESGTTMMQNSFRAKVVREVWDQAAARGELGVAFLRLNGEAIAGGWGYFDGDRFLSVHELRDVAHAKNSVGLGLMDEVVRAGPEQGVRWIDASRGNPAGTHVLCRYHGPARRHAQFTIPRPGWRGWWVRACLAIRTRRGLVETWTL